MTARAEWLLERFYDDADHPYRILTRALDAAIGQDFTILDAGCGRTAPMLVRYRGQAARLIGVDLVAFTERVDGVELHNWDLGRMDLPDESVDLIYSRSVMEHIAHPDAVYREMYRVLKPGGRSIFLTANKWDYASIIAALVPNAWHPKIVRHTEGREECDVFPTQYKTNTRRDILRHAGGSGLDVEEFRYLGQYPSYFMFNSLLFLLGTAYQKAIQAVPALSWLQGWILVSLRKPAGVPIDSPVALADERQPARPREAALLLESGSSR
jgi:ubiquinone/menaquinone biosynthesis C-methylase UbiE